MEELLMAGRNGIASAKFFDEDTFFNSYSKQYARNEA
jgi:hypothetical protein